jgi:hypothetical protein
MADTSWLIGSCVAKAYLNLIFYSAMKITFSILSLTITAESVRGSFSILNRIASSEIRV